MKKIVSFANVSRTAAGGMVLSGLLYFVLRFVKGRDDVSAFILSLSAYTLLLVLGWMLLRTFEVRDLRGWKAAWPALLLAGIGLLPLSTRVLDNLVVLESISEPEAVYLSWEKDGVVKRLTDADERTLHRGGDEVAHLAYARAIHEHGPNPFTLRKAYNDVHVTGVDWAYSHQFEYTAYWLWRGSIQHPPGFAIFYAPFIFSPPLARTVAFFMFIIAVGAAGWAGWRCFGTVRTGMAFALGFACIPHVQWWHATSVSSDILPCIPAFLAIGLVGLPGKRGTIRAGSETWRLLGAGLLFGIAVYITYTALLAALMLCLLFLEGPWPRRINRAALVLTPAVLAILMGMFHSSIMQGLFQDNPLAPLQPVGRSFEGSVSGVGRDFAGRTIYLLQRLPLDLGLPLCILLFSSLGFAFYGLFRKPGRQDVLLLLGFAGIFVLAFYLVPYRPQIRFLFPVLPWMLAGIGLPRFLASCSRKTACMMLAAVWAFAVSKYLVLMDLV